MAFSPTPSRGRKNHVGLSVLDRLAHIDELAAAGLESVGKLAWEDTGINFHGNPGLGLGWIVPVLQHFPDLI